MNDGVKILLERIQTHPQEFHGDFNRWSDVINKFEKFFNTSERALINGALTNIRREEFTSVVMQELLKEHKVGSWIREEHRIQPSRGEVK